MLELLAGPDPGANSMFTQRCGMECVSNTHAHISVLMEKIWQYILATDIHRKRDHKKLLSLFMSRSEEDVQLGRLC